MYTWVLECGHSVKAVDNGEGFCPRCRHVYGVTTEWQAKCLDCTFSVRTGAATMECQTKAGRHARRKRGHRVEIMDPDGKVFRTAYWIPKDNSESPLF